MQLTIRYHCPIGCIFSIKIRVKGDPGNFAMLTDGQVEKLRVSDQVIADHVCMTPPGFLAACIETTIGYWMVKIPAIGNTIDYQAP